MLATFTIVGRLYDIPAGSDDDCRVTVRTERPFRQEDGKLETDLIRIRLWKGAALEWRSIDTPGCPVVIRGRIQTDRNGRIELIGEKAARIREEEAY